jgi:hypothetical protein
MVVPTGLSHVAMTVPPGTLTDAYRAELLDVYGRLFGWREMEELRLPDRLSISVGRHSYINIRERPDPMACSDYEHFGIVVSSAEKAERIWQALEADPRVTHLEGIQRGEDGFRSFRFRYLLPLTVEVQFFP